MLVICEMHEFFSLRVQLDGSVASLWVQASVRSALAASLWVASLWVQASLCRWRGVGNGASTQKEGENEIFGVKGDHIEIEEMFDFGV